MKVGTTGLDETEQEVEVEVGCLARDNFVVNNG